MRAPAWVLFLALAALADGPTLEVSLEAGAAQDGPPWSVLSIRGNANLPDRAILQVFVYDETVDPPVMLDQTRCETKGGAFAAPLSRTKGPPLSGSYRAEVVFDPERQRDDVLEGMTPRPSQETHAEAHLVVGGPGDREKDLAREKDRLRKDLDLLTALADELATRLAETKRAGFDRATYGAWEAEWTKRLEAREAENHLRPYVKVLQLAMVGQARHQGLVQLLHDAGAAPLTEAPPETLLVRAQGGLERFRTHHREVLTETGLAEAAAAPAIDAGPFRALAGEVAAQWTSGTPDAAWIGAWRVRWAEALAAALPALAMRSDRTAADLATLGAQLGSAPDAASATAIGSRLATLLDSLQAGPHR